MVFGQFLRKLKFSDEKEQERIQSNQIATNSDDGAIELEEAINSFTINLDWSVNSQWQLIDTYRQIANYNVVDYAIEDIVNEMVTYDEDEDPISLDLGDLEDELSESLRNKIHEKWEKVCRIIEMRDSIHRRAKQFYTDGRLAYQKVIDQKKPQDGLLDVIELDVSCVTKIRNKVYNEETRTIDRIEEFFVYDEDIRERNAGKKETNKKKFRPPLQLDPNSITYVTSGLTDMRSGYAISWLHKAVKPANQLRMMENALVIYRITRAPERRIFYVDTANLPKSKAEQYIRSLKANYRNRMSFDPDSGSFQDQRHQMTMQEDFWMPRNSSGRGTEVDTLPGGQNLSDIDDVIYFQKQLYKALNIPVTRLEADSFMQLGRATEISRDELKFTKFVSKIRKRFNMMLLDLLKTELILTKVITVQEWNDIQPLIKFKYAQNMYLEEMKQSEMLRDRLDLADSFQSYVGKYVPNDFIRREIFKHSEQEMKEFDEKIQEEKDNPQFNPPEDDPSF